MCFSKEKYIIKKTHSAKDSKAAYWFGTKTMPRMFVGMSIKINEEMFVIYRSLYVYSLYEFWDRRSSGSVVFSVRQASGRLIFESPPRKTLKHRQNIGYIRKSDLSIYVKYCQAKCKIMHNQSINKSSKMIHIKHNMIKKWDFAFLI